MTSRKTLLLALLVALSSNGCANAIVFATSYQLGIEVNAVENGQQTARVAVSKTEGVTMPVCKDPERWPLEDCDDLRKQAYSTISMSDLQTGTLLLGALTTTRVRQVFATGDAAKEASAPKAVSETFSALTGATTEYGGDEATDCLERWVDQGHRDELRQWMTKNGHTVTPTSFLFGKEYAADRVRAVEALDVPCDAAGEGEPRDE
jgi:hypothetical protein